jgi:hypothetical protein
MKYAVEMDSGAMIYISGFINICSGIKKLIGGINRHKTWGSHKPTFFRKKESRLKWNNLTFRLKIICSKIH